MLRRLMAGSMRLRSLERRTPQLLGAQAFREELDREMLCADRLSTTLTLLLLGVEPAEGGDELEELALLATIVAESTRKTDRKGWFRDATGVHVGLILVHTPPERTERIIENIRERYREALQKAGRDPLRRLRCEIYSYPPYPIVDEPGGGGRKTEAAPRGGDHGAEPAPTAPEAGEAGHGEKNGNGHGAVETAEGRTMEPARRAGAAMAAPWPSVMEVLLDPTPLWKRALDVSWALAMLLALSPLMLLIALAIKLSSPGPVIFKQPRVGYRGRVFLSWKFRSMRPNAETKSHQRYLASLINQAKGEGEGEERPMIKLDKVDPRITPVGRILRITCLDELPQLFNVLRGEMSLVGPRPCLPYEAENYERWHLHRLDTLPGITGLWQVKGKNRVTFRKMIRLDILYARQRSLWLDISILFQTIPAVLREIRDGLPTATK